MGARGSRYRQRERCSARRSDGEPCQAWAIHGAAVCSAHGGRAPEVARKAAEAEAERKLEAWAERSPAFRAATQLARSRREAGGLSAVIADVLDRTAALAMVTAPAGVELEDARAALVFSTKKGPVIEPVTALHVRVLRDLAALARDAERLGIERRTVELAEAETRELLDRVERAIDAAGLGDHLDAIRAQLAAQLMEEAGGGA